MYAPIIAPIMKEVGWHGYGTDSLGSRFGMMKSTLIFGVLWSIWHAPLFLIDGTYQNDLLNNHPLYVVNFFISVIPAAFIANWFYYKNKSLISGAILLHATLSSASVILNAGQVAKCVATVLYMAVAVILVVRDRALFREGPHNPLSRERAFSPIAWPSVPVALPSQRAEYSPDQLVHR